MEDKYNQDDRVILSHSAYLNLHGILRYKGPIEGTPPGTWFGVELDEPKGKNSGDHKDVFYFKCEPKHGVFVRIANLRSEAEGEVDVSPSKIPENDSPSKVPSKEEKPATETTIKIEKIPSQKEKIEEKPKLVSKPIEKPIPSTTKPLEEKPKLEKIEKKPVVVAKDSKLIKKQPTTKEIPAPSTLKKTLTTTTVPVEKKPIEKKPIPTKKTTPGPSTATTIGGITKKTNFAKKIDKKPLEEETKSLDSKEEATEEVEEENTEQIKVEDDECSSNFNPESTQIETEDGSRFDGIEELKLLRNEIDEKNYEISTKDQEIKELNIRLLEVTKRYQEMEKDKEKAGNAADFENLNNLKVMQVEQKLKEAERKSKHMENDYLRLKKEFELQKDHLQQHESFTSMVEGLSIENESLKANIEALTMEIEENKVEIKKLKEENEIMLLEMEEAMEMPKLSEESSTASLEQLQENNGKLRLAIQILNEKYENEQIFHLEQIDRYKLALERIPELQLKVRELDEKKQLLILKEQENEELKNRLDEGSEYQEMIEMLTNDLMKKEEEIIDYKRAIKDLKEERDINNQLIEANEDENKELNRYIETKEQEIFALCKKIKEHEEANEENEKYINKFREKTSQLTKEIEMYRDNAQKTGGEESRNMKRIEELLQRQLEILSDKREIYKKMINSNIMNYKLSNESLTTTTFLKTLPPIFLEKLHLEAFDKFIMVRTIRAKALFLLQELQGNFINPQQAKDNIDLVNWVSRALLYLNTVVYCLDNLEIAMIFLNSEEQYLDLSKNSFIGTCMAIKVIIDSMLRTHREEAMSVKIPIEPLKILANKLLEQTNGVIKKYIDRDNDEENEEEDKNLKKFLRIVKIMYRNKYELMRVRIYTENIWLVCMNREYDQEKFEKSVLKINDTLEKIYRKIYLFLQIKNRHDAFISISRGAIDKILHENVFQESEELETNEIISILAEYYEKIIDSFISDKESFHLLVKDIFDKLDNLFGKLIVSVPKFKRFSLISDGNLVHDPMSLEGDGNLDEFQGSNARVFGPWDLCSQRMNDELQKVLENVENFEKMNNELKEQVKKALRYEEDLKALNIIKESLELRVADLQNKSERVAILENDKKRLLEREQHFNQATEVIKKELENAEKKNQELEEELSEVRSGANVASLPQEGISEPQAQGGFNRKSVFKSDSRSTLTPFSRTSVVTSSDRMLGGELMRGGGASGINIMGTMNMNIGDTGDSLECLDIIQRLLAENCYLKSVEMRERLQKLKKTMPKFSRYHQEVKTMNESAKNPHGMVNLSRKINEVQKKAQQKLIEVKVIDLEELKEMKIVHKNENIEKFLKNSKTNFDELKKEAHGVAFQMHKQFKAEIDENQFETCIDAGLLEALKNINKYAKVGSLEFINAGKGSSEIIKHEKLILNSKEFAEFTRKLVI